MLSGRHEEAGELVTETLVSRDHRVMFSGEELRGRAAIVENSRAIEAVGFETFTYVARRRAGRAQRARPHRVRDEQ